MPCPRRDRITRDLPLLTVRASPPPSPAFGARRPDSASLRCPSEPSGTHHRRIRDGGGDAVPCNRLRTSLGRSRLRLAWGLHSALATEGSFMPTTQAASTPRPRKLEPELFGPLEGTPAMVTNI